MQGSLPNPENFSENVTFPFDWLFLPLPNVAPALSAEMHDEFDFDCLRKDSYPGGPAIVGKYAVHDHDFPDEVMTAEDESWRDSIPTLRSCYDFMWRSLEDAANGDILFIRCYADDDEYLRACFPELISGIMQTLRKKFSSARVTLLLVDYKLTDVLDEQNILSAEVTSYQSQALGCDRGWREMFERLDIKKRSGLT